MRKCPESRFDPDELRNLTRTRSGKFGTEKSPVVELEADNTQFWVQKMSNL